MVKVIVEGVKIQSHLRQDMNNEKLKSETSNEARKTELESMEGMQRHGNN